MGQKIVYSHTACAKNIDAVEDALYVLGGKWKLRIVIALESGHCRFNELQRVIKGISARVLSNELKQLEMNGLVKRVVHADKTPVVVEYRPTEYASTLKDVVSALADWGQKHRKKITTNR
ncbi:MULTISPECIES: winged helix-turn-helix transcriptional regulator [Bacteroidota]|jgi:DNA-binding HxlR family transcriptional regulator|uniref:HxlR family transcriptional regulator n=2 Tax=Weeksellaceae TaxID=2762318 RepID=A0A0G3LZX9_CHRGL|nr:MULTISPECIES: helix-turn-helix domain-containing protein [Bacteroidota]AKK71940.1 HxlR family transcriptional regulator [Chryseobacterium gallinarum]ANI89762.1 HxlR family transcriptional regulator [Arachidicoccus sp. BS20]MDQ0107179.1 DNA-binding HxlR family transcriptional regulator [Chitinophaga terrae (ex Kim and Jung 2007)]MDV3970668.1 transcriptional regulator [Elizabethkingia anophelis]DAC74628.1 TPA_exp: transcriptional regulator, HxlR family [Elizabethkingia anophelis]